MIVRVKAQEDSADHVPIVRNRPEGLSSTSRPSVCGDGPLEQLVQLALFVEGELGQW